VDAHPEFRSQNPEFRRISPPFADKCAAVRVHAIEAKSGAGGEARKSLLCNFLDSGFWILCDSTKLNRTPQCVNLPSLVQADKVEARYENGVLTINVPKAPIIKNAGEFRARHGATACAREQTSHAGDAGKRRSGHAAGGRCRRDQRRRGRLPQGQPTHHRRLVLLVLADRPTDPVINDRRG
jgi:hypothetical protein